MVKKYVQDPPFAVQVELAEGCNLRCSFCGLNGIRGKDKTYNFMEEKTLSSLMSQIVKEKWNPRIEFAVHGEPTMHPDFVGMVRLAREAAPRLQLMMTSNGGGLMRAPGPLLNVTALFSAGLNILALDDYDGVNFVDKVRRAVTSASEKSPEVLEDMKIYEYPSMLDGNPHQRVGHRGRMLTLVQNIPDATRGTHSHLNNHAGAAAPPNDKMAGKRCAKPFRELTVRWDGNVAVSCNDWRGMYKCGNVVRDGLDAVWNGEQMHAARQKLYYGERDFGPCNGCDAMSHRVGLLPDKFGKEKMPKPDKKTDEVIRRALAGKPYTAPVLRPWELKP
jgi:hypothetical protein